MKYALITGANSALASTFIKSVKDDYHFFLVDTSNQLEETFSYLQNKTLIVGDLTNEETRNNLYALVNNITDHLDLIIHFAGLLEIGPLVEVPLVNFERIMKVNLFIIYELNKMFFNHLRLSKGRIIHLSSEYGFLLALPFHSFYTMSKKALEVYNDSLRRELQGFGIKVIKIRPGAIKSAMQGNVTKKFDALLLNTKNFAGPLTKMQKMMLTELKNAKDPKKLVKTFIKATTKKKPKRVYNVCQSKRMKILNRMPVFMQDYIISKFFH